VLDVIAFPDLLAYAGAGVTVVGGIIGVILGEATQSRRSLEDLALGAAVGGFLGCFIAIIVYLLTSLIRS
jgi:zinc transporter ZupT